MRRREGLYIQLAASLRKSYFLAEMIAQVVRPRAAPFPDAERHAVATHAVAGAIRRHPIGLLHSKLCWVDGILLDQMNAFVMYLGWCGSVRASSCGEA